MAKTSIILPVYNVEAYLDHCLQSILAQTNPYFELLLINDGSTDTSGAICDRYAKKDQRIQVIHQENQGLAMARNRGLDVATGEYILFVDSDDYVHQDLLKVLYQQLTEYDADVAVGGYQVVAADEQSGRYERAPYTNEQQLLTAHEAVREIVEKSQTQMIIACGKLYKRSCFKDIRYPQGKYHEDEFVTYQIVYAAEKIVVTETPLYFYRQRSDSITGERYSLKRLDKLEALKQAIAFFEERQEKELALAARTRYLLNIQISYYKVTNEMKGLEKVLDALKKEYQRQYKELQATDVKLSFFQALTLRAFAYAPNVYTKIVHLFVKCGINF